MENSAFIVQRGLEVIQSELQRMGFQLKWTIISAAEVGSPQQRRRWFGLAWRGTVPQFGTVDNVGRSWKQEPVPRLLRVIDRRERSTARQ